MQHDDLESDRAAYTKIRRDIASVWWDRVPKEWQAYLVKKTGLPATFDIADSSPHERWKLATAAESLIHTLEPAVRVKV